MIEKFCIFAANKNRKTKSVVGMGKPFERELLEIDSTLEWVDLCDVKELRDFLCHNPQIPLFSIGSGGSFSACHFSSLLYNEHCNVGVPITPLGLRGKNPLLLQHSKLLFISASGKNKDIQMAFNYGLDCCEEETGSLCCTTNNKLEDLSHNYDGHRCFHYSLPAKKDGFLATNSLVAFFGLLLKAYYPSVVLAGRFGKEEEAYSVDSEINLSDIQNFVVLYGKYGEPVAFDLESKLTEAALGTTLLSDYRNFGHGRHHWFDKRGGSSCIISVQTDIDKELAEKTIGCLPKGIPVICIESSLPDAQATLDLLIKSFYFVKELGMVRGIDPGKPGVPDYGTALYNLNYKKTLDRLKFAPTLEEISIIRKAHINNLSLLDEEQYQFYHKKYCEFVKKVISRTFSKIVFDYDGTLSCSNYDSRYRTTLNESVRDALIKLLSHKVEVGIVTGRGGSIVEILKASIPETYWPWLYVGNYNGMVVYRLDKEEDLSTIERSDLNPSLEVVFAELLRRSPYVNEKHIKKRKNQLTIQNRVFSNDVFKCCQEIIVDKDLDGIKVWLSSHSMDVVVSSVVDKRNMVTMLGKADDVLCIGDSGDVCGNDFQLMSLPYSLSVGKVSNNPLCCWNISPYGCKETSATLYYLSKMKVGVGVVKCNFKI